jgi:hypothetical protein
MKLAAVTALIALAITTPALAQNSMSPAPMHGDMHGKMAGHHRMMHHRMMHHRMMHHRMMHHRMMHHKKMMDKK